MLLRGLCRQPLQGVVRCRRRRCSSWCDDSRRWWSTTQAHRATGRRVERTAATCQRCLQRPGWDGRSTAGHWSSPTGKCGDGGGVVKPVVGERRERRLAGRGRDDCWRTASVHHVQHASMSVGQRLNETWQMTARCHVGGSDVRQLTELRTTTRWVVAGCRRCVRHPGSRSFIAGRHTTSGRHVGPRRHCGSPTVAVSVLIHVIFPVRPLNCRRLACALSCFRSSVRWRQWRSQERLDAEGLGDVHCVCVCVWYAVMFSDDVPSSIIDWIMCDVTASASAAAAQRRRGGRCCSQRQATMGGACVVAELWLDSLLTLISTSSFVYKMIFSFLWRVSLAEVYQARHCL